MTRVRLTVFCATIAMSLVSLPRDCQAIAWEERVAARGKPVATTDEQEGWPAGTVDFLNGPLRGNGWRFFFSECPNDVQRFEFFANATAEVNAVIEQFAKIKPPLAIAISPDEGVTHSALIAQEPGSPRARVMFWVGSQPVLSKWYQRLRVDANGDRLWGAHRFTEEPAATPPTLHIYVGSGAIRLDELRIPDTIRVGHQLSLRERVKREDSPVVKEITEFVRQRRQPLPAN